MKEEKLLERGRCFDCGSITTHVWEYYEDFKFYIVEFCLPCYHHFGSLINKGRVREIRGEEEEGDLDFDPRNVLSKESDIHRI